MHVRIKVGGITTPDAAAAASELGVDAVGFVFAESPRRVDVREALQLAPSVDINPSGGALAGNIIMAAGLDRIGEAATRIIAGDANRAVGHATSGPCLQQNLVAVLEGE